MKNILKLFLKAVLILFVMLAFAQVNAQRRYAPLANTDYRYTIENDAQVSDRIMEFDLYIKDTDNTQPFELSIIQAGVYISKSITGTGTLTASIVSGSSELVTAMQPTAISYASANTTQGIIKLAAKTGPGCGAGTFISQIEPGTRVCRIRITNTIAFVTNSQAGLLFCFTTTPYATKVFQYTSYTPCTSTQMVSNMSNCYNGANYHNIYLNPQPPIAYNMTGGGSYCHAAGGLPVGLAGSQIGVTYILYQDAIAQTPTVSGTGGAITFGNQLGTHTYTIKGNGFGSITDMIGSAVITEILCPLTWSGAINSNWNFPGNWVLGSVPLATDDVIIPSGKPYYPILNPSDIIECHNISIESGASVTINKECNVPNAPTAGINSPGADQIIWNWNPVTGANGYKWSITDDCTTAIDLGTNTTKTETGLTCNTTYTRYIWAYNTCGNSTSTVLAQATIINPSSPDAGIHLPGMNQIVWNWNTVTGVTGYKWNTTNNYTTAIDMGSNITKTETGLSCNTLYTRYVWAYNTCGTSPVTILTQSTTVYTSCPTSITDARDGKVYNTVVIGCQCWMAQNLNVGARINGSVNQTNNGIIEKYCYDNDDANCAIYGGLYQWNEMMQYVTNVGAQGICPTGWHIPSDAEFTALTTYLGGESIAGGKMKSIGTIEDGTGLWETPNTGATDKSGFTALPGGERNYGLGGFGILSLNGIFWSSSYSVGRTLFYDDDEIYSWSGANTDTGFSVRCVKN